ncbi:MAG: hypothetical protein HC875_24065 [Anaerolineales bacterium]|nr:hypothetical protein [Anaerolineales bacterium]
MWNFSLSNLRRGLTVSALALVTVCLMGLKPLAGEPANKALISPEQATALAVNNWREIPAGYELLHPRYRVAFTAEGVTFAARPAVQPGSGS